MILKNVVPVSALTPYSCSLPQKCRQCCKCPGGSLAQKAEAEALAEAEGTSAEAAVTAPTPIHREDSSGSDKLTITFSLVEKKQSRVERKGENHNVDKKSIVVCLVTFLLSTSCQRLQRSYLIQNVISSSNRIKIYVLLRCR